MKIKNLFRGSIESLLLNGLKRGTLTVAIILVSVGLVSKEINAQKLPGRTSKEIIMLIKNISNTDEKSQESYAKYGDMIVWKAMHEADILIESKENTKALKLLLVIKGAIEPWGLDNLVKQCENKIRFVEQEIVNESKAKRAGPSIFIILKENLNQVKEIDRKFYIMVIETSKMKDVANQKVIQNSIFITKKSKRNFKKVFFKKEQKLLNGLWEVTLITEVK